jgi:hypothetical protein
MPNRFHPRHHVGNGQGARAWKLVLVAGLNELGSESWINLHFSQKLS